MKLKSLLVFPLLLTSPLFADILNTPNTLDFNGPIPFAAKIDHLYIPNGFDQNDIAEIIVSGELPDSCHQVGEPTFEIDPETKVIRVGLLNYKTDREICIQMVVPYMRVIKLGHLPVGSFKVVPVGQPDFTTELKIYPSDSSSQDDYIYLPIEFADLMKDATGKQNLYLTGRLPKLKRGCMKLERTVIQEVGGTMGKMVIVQPIAKISEENCNHSPSSEFHEVVEMPAPFSGEGLLHVRSLNGEAFNRIIFPNN